MDTADMQIDGIPSTKRKADSEVDGTHTHKRKLPCYMKKTCVMGMAVGDSRTLPDELLEKIATIVAIRQELEDDAGQDEKHRFFLEHEVLAILDIIDTPYYSLEEERDVFSRVRAASRMLIVGIGAMLEGKTLEQVRYNMSNSRWCILSDMQKTAYDLAGVFQEDY